MKRIDAVQRLIPTFTSFSRKSTVAKVSKPVVVNDGQKCLDLNTSNVLSASMAQPQASSLLTEPLTRADAISVLEPSVADIPSTSIGVSPAKMETQTAMDMSVLPFEEIPGPAILKIWEKYWKYVPLLGRLSWNRNVTPLNYLFNEYGCIVRIRGPLSGHIVMIHRPEHIAEVFKQEADTPIRSGIDILQHYRLHYRKYRLAGPFSLQGPEWMEVREKVEQDFIQISSNFFNEMDVVCDELINRIYKIRNRQDEVPANFHENMIRWCMECFYALIFNKHLRFLEQSGYNSTSESSRIINAIMTAHKYMSRCETGFQVWRFFLTPFAKKLFEACDVLDGVMSKYVRQAQCKLRSRSKGIQSGTIEEGSPILEKFLLNDNIHPDDICTILLDMVILGVQATANCEAFLLYFLAKNPRCQKKLYDEIMSIVPNKTAPFAEKTLKNMPYLKACMRESLRLRPAFPYVSRLLPKTLSLHGYTIPKGTFVIMANEIASRRQENFEDPEKFLPERWLNNSTIENTNFSCLPFGYGARSCLGKEMAETQMMLLTAKLVRQFKIEYDYADIKSSYMMVNVPNKSLRFRFVDRY